MISTLLADASIGICVYSEREGHGNCVLEINDNGKITKILCRFTRKDKATSNEKSSVIAVGMKIHISDAFSSSFMRRQTCIMLLVYDGVLSDWIS